jgi:hypothetical protein
LDRHLLESLTHKLMSGQKKIVVSGKVYTILPPSLDILLEADLEYSRTIESGLFDGLMFQKDLIGFLVSRKLWEPDGDSRLEQLDKEIDNQKYSLYMNFKTFNLQAQKKDREKLVKLKAKQLERLTIRHGFDHLTLEGHAASIREEYIISRSIKEVPVRRLHFSLLSDILVEINKNSISLDKLRLVARVDPWRLHWSIYGHEIFTNYPLTDEQKTVASFSQLYDNIHKHPECPDDSVIADDDMLDGWLVYCRKENQKNSKDKPRQISSKIEEHKEVFMRAKNKEEAQAIYNQNDEEARAIVKSRQSVAGVVKESQLPDRQLELRTLAVERSKNGKSRK